MARKEEKSVDKKSDKKPVVTLGVEELRHVRGGTSTQDFHFVMKFNKATPSLMHNKATPILMLNYATG